MGKLVNVVLPGGKTVAVTEEEAAQLGDVVRRQTDQEQHQGAVDARSESHFSGPMQKLKTFAEGVADTATAGGYGKIAGVVSEDYAEQMRGRAQQNPGTRFLAEAATVVAPGGLLGKAAKGASAVTAEGLFARAGTAIGGKTGRVVEGGLSGVAGYSAQTNVTGDPLTIEGAVASGGVGSILTLGFGALGDRVGKMSAKAKSHADEAAELTKDVESLAANRRAIESFDQSPAYEEARLANDTWQKTQKKAATQYDRDAKTYNKFVYGSPVPKNTSGSALTIAIGKAENVINKIEGRWSPRVADEPASKFDLSDVGDAQKAAPDGPVEVISAETKARLDGWRARISEMYKLKGGGWRVDGGRWVPDPTVKADPAGVTEHLRALQEEIKQAYPKASGKLSNLPDMPSTPIVHEGAKLPASLKEFARQHEGTIERLVTDLDPSTKNAFLKLADDLGLEKLGTPEDTIRAVHQKLRAVLGTHERVTAKMTKKEAESATGLVGWMRTFLRGAAGLALGRTANRAMGGGASGAIAQVGASNAARSAMKGIESGLLDKALLVSKDGVRGKVRDLVAKYGGRTAAGATKLGPVTAYLSQSFPFAEPDDDADISSKAVKRIMEINHAATVAPDALYLAVEGMLGHPGDIGWKVHNQIMQGLNYLVAMAPKDPGIDVTMFKSNWKPSTNDTVAFAHTMEAVLDPHTALERAMQGDAHPAAIDALWATMPATMTELGAEVAASAHTFGDISMRQAGNFSRIFRRPMTALQEPQVIALVQGMYLPRPEQAAASTGTKNPGGRPPAVQSRVAGSSVSALIS